MFCFSKDWQSRETTCCKKEKFEAQSRLLTKGFGDKCRRHGSHVINYCFGRWIERSEWKPAKGGVALLLHRFMILRPGGETFLAPTLTLLDYVTVITFADGTRLWACLYLKTSIYRSRISPLLYSCTVLVNRNISHSNITFQPGKFFLSSQETSFHL